MHEIRNINVNCLKPSRDPLLVGIYQPKNSLVSTDDIGPHYEGQNRVNQINQIEQFLSLAREKHCQLIIFPEYSFPVDCLLKLCVKEYPLGEDTFIVAPLESIPKDRLPTLIDELLAIDTCTAEALPIDETHGTCANICAFVALSNGAVSVFLQPKRNPSSWESSSLCKGNKYYIFRGGEGKLTLSTLICSDANESQTYDDQLVKVGSGGRYLIHTQWNPSPMDSNYDELWKKTISHEKNDFISILFSTNVAHGSTVSKNGHIDETISLPYSRIAASGRGKESESYMNVNQISAFKSLLEAKHGQIFNLVYPHDCSHFVTMRRPHEGNVPANTNTKKLISRCETFKYSGIYSLVTQDDIYSEIASYLKSKYATSKDEITLAFQQLNNHLPENIETIFSSCAIKEYGAWLNKDLTKRPIIWIGYLTSILGTPPDETENEIDWFHGCIQNLSACNDMGYLLADNGYPLNLKHSTEPKNGWLANSIGLSKETLAGRIALLLSKFKTARPSHHVMIFIVGNNDITKGMVSRASISITDGLQVINEDRGIEDPHPSILLEEIRSL